jgi:hypothetical protein
MEVEGSNHKTGVLTHARGERHRVHLCFTLARTGQINGSTTGTEYSVMRIE